MAKGSNFPFQITREKQKHDPRLGLDNEPLVLDFGLGKFKEIGKIE
jgi:hypothetical protein